MLAALGYASLDELADAVVPAAIRLARPLSLGDRLPPGEHARSTGAAGAKRTVFWVQSETHPQTIAVMRTRAEPLGIALRTGSTAEIAAALSSVASGDVAGVLLSYPTTDGRVEDHRAVIG